MKDTRISILWIFDQPLIPEAGGTERVSSLIIHGLTTAGYNCFGHLVIKESTDICYYNTEPISDLYRFLKDNDIQVIVNQKAQDPSFLRHFLRLGGAEWKKEGGKIISCLHFNPQPIAEYYDIVFFQHSLLKKAYHLLLLKLFPRHHERKQKKHLAQQFLDVYNNSDAFVVLTQTHRRYIEDVIGARQHCDSIHVIPNPLSFTHPCSNEELDKKANIALFVGRMDEYYKRVSIILKAWKYLEESHGLIGWELHLVGDGPYLNKYKEYCYNNRIKGVHFHGRAVPEKHYQSAKVFLMTSISEGLPMTILESFQYGVVPIVIDSCPVFSEIINDGIDGVLCHSDDPKQFAETIYKVIENNNGIKKMAENAIISANNYRPDNIIKLWCSLINVVLNK